MAGFASLEKDGHAGELGSSGIKLGEEKYQVRRRTVTGFGGGGVHVQQSNARA